MKKIADLKNKTNFFHQHTFDNLPDAVLWLNKKGKIEFFNNPATELYLYAKSELLKLSIFDIEPDCNDKFWTERWNNAISGQKVSYNSIHRKKSGLNFSVEIHDSIIEDNGVEYVCSIVRDISVYKEREQKLRDALIELKVSEKLLHQSHLLFKICLEQFFGLKRKVLSNQPIIPHATGLNNPKMNLQENPLLICVLIFQ
ncbi:MAG: PAS domain S-box protein [Bacteroidales bacterium]|nr:PAS domain S-box protein [Bacteroidales bacterium]